MVASRSLDVLLLLVAEDDKIHKYGSSCKLGLESLCQPLSLFLMMMVI